MELSTKLRTFIVDYISASPLRTFGGGRGSQWNPLAEALKDAPVQFAAGVDVGEVVDTILEAVEFAHNQMENAQRDT